MTAILEFQVVEITGELPDCLHCANCGKWLFIPLVCLIHEQSCPFHSWMVSAAAESFMSYWKLETNGQVPNDAQWEEAKTMAVRDQTLTGAAIARELLD